MSHSPKSACAALSLTECVVVVSVVVVVVTFVVLPALNSRRGHPGVRLVCASNLKGIGTSGAIYANDNNSRWPVPAFDESMTGQIDYAVPVGGGYGSRRSPNCTQPSEHGNGGARQLSVTRSMWMLVRSGDITTKQFLCPTSGDRENNRKEVELYLDSYYDFADYRSVSYGYQVPFGPQITRAGDWMPRDMPLAADKGPFLTANTQVPSESLAATVVTVPSSDIRQAGEWRPFNSLNHAGEGQNVLFRDGHVQFLRTPIVGIGLDNIYTVALDALQVDLRVRGESPWARSAPPLLTVDPEGRATSANDSVIFP
jgi:hypothetical protein